MSTEDQILLKLVIQGQDPSEIQRLAASTQGELNAKIKVYLDQLTELHRQAREAQSADAVNAAKKQIDIAEKQVEMLAKVARANEIAANRATNSWRQTLEVMENIATATRFAYDVISSGFSRLGQLGEQIDHITNVYGALKGSIDEMREASRGQVSDYDLITTKNRALEKELQLTDQQFGAVAAAADNFADAIGENTKEALNKLVDGLATGRLKMLEHAGVVINADEAYKRYAKSIGVAGDQLSDHGKKVALIQEALRAMDKKLVDSGVNVENFADKWEVITAKLKNMWDTVLKTLGEFVVKAVEGFTIDLPDAIRLAIAKIKDLMPGSNGEAVAAVVAQHDKNLADFYGQKDNQKQVDAAKARLADPNAYEYQGAGPRSGLINQDKIDEAAKKAQAEADALQKIIDSFDKMLRKGSGIDMQSIAANDNYQQTADEKAVGNAYDPSASRNALLGLNNSTARTQALAKAQAARQANIDRSMEGLNENNDLSRGTDSKGAIERMEKSLKDAQDRIDDLRKRSGDGILSAAIFGTDGPGGMKEKLRTFSQDAADALGMVSDAGTKMGAALGGALAAFVSGDKSKRASLRQTTHDILEALATQAYSRAIFETAEGLASLALGPIGGASAGLHFAAAGMFTAVGTGAALSARAIGNSPTANQGAGGRTSTGSSGGISTTNSGSGGFGSNGQRSSPAQNSQPLTISLTVLPGGEAEAGRQINKALNAYYSQTGQGVPAAMVAA